MQETLLAKVNEETLRSLTKARESGDGASGATRKVSDVVTYRSMAELPQLRDFQIHVRALDRSCMCMCRCMRARMMLLPVASMHAYVHLPTAVLRSGLLTF